MAIESILIMIAMEAEAKPLLDKLALQKEQMSHPWAPFELYSGMHSNGLTKISVCVNGKAVNAGGVDNVGTTPAAVATFLMITELKPSIVINAGTAGGFKSKGAAIGDAFVATMCRHHDRRITIPGWDDYARGHHEMRKVPNLIKALGFKQGVVTTGNSLDAHDVDRDIMTQNDASVKDMEAAAIAWVTEHSNTPFLALKVVTDIVDGDQPTHEEFMENLGTAAKSLEKNLLLTVEFVVKEGVDKL